MAMEHAADWHKLHQTQKYGGIALDFDVFFLNGSEFAKKQKNAKCVLACEGDQCNVISLGLVSCSKSSTFLRNWIKHYYTDYHPNERLYNSAYVPSMMLVIVIIY